MEGKSRAAVNCTFKENNIIFFSKKKEVDNICNIYLDCAGGPQVERPPSMAYLEWGGRESD